MTSYVVCGRTTQSRSTRLARIVDEGKTIQFTVTGGPTWTVSREQLDSLLHKYARLGYPVRISRSPQRRAA